MCYTIEEIKQKTIPIAKTYGVERVNLFGSYARGEARDESDIDFYIDKGRIKGLIEYFSFIAELEKAFNCHVDVVTTTISDKEFLSKIESERIMLYEASWYYDNKEKLEAMIWNTEKYKWYFAPESKKYR